MINEKNQIEMFTFHQNEYKETNKTIKIWKQD